VIFVASGLLACIITPLLNARLREAWSFQEMFNKSDLVVIARVVTATDKKDSVSLPGFDTSLKVIEVLTKFESRIVFKGPKGLSKFLLHHYRYRSEAEEFGVANNAQLVKINPGEHPAFLLFLVKERDGVYAPFGGQTDPAALSVLDLRGGGD
jgi:hypothetical protein